MAAECWHTRVWYYESKLATLLQFSDKANDKDKDKYKDKDKDKDKGKDSNMADIPSCLILVLGQLLSFTSQTKTPLYNNSVALL